MSTFNKRKIALFILVLITIITSGLYLYYRDTMKSISESFANVNKGVVKVVPENQKVLLKDFRTAYPGEEYDLSEMVLIVPLEE